MAASTHPIAGRWFCIFHGAPVEKVYLTLSASDGKVEVIQISRESFDDKRQMAQLITDARFDGTTLTVRLDRNDPHSGPPIYNGAIVTANLQADGELEGQWEEEGKLGKFVAKRMSVTEQTNAPAVSLEAEMIEELNASTSRWVSSETSKIYGLGVGKENPDFAKWVKSNLAVRFEAIKRDLIDPPPSGHWIVGICGPAGSGKTSLATAIAQDEEIRQNFPDGIFFVSAARRQSLREQIHELRASAFPEARFSHDSEWIPIGRRGLLIVDEFEQDTNDPFFISHPRPRREW